MRELEQARCDLRRDVGKAHAAHEALQTALQQREARLAAAQHEGAQLREQLQAESARVRELQGALLAEEGREAGLRQQGHAKEVCACLPSPAAAASCALLRRGVGDAATPSCRATWQFCRPQATCRLSTMHLIARHVVEMNVRT